MNVGCSFAARVSRSVISFIKWNIIIIALISGISNANAASIVVPSNGDLQAAINTAQPGDTIVVEAGPHMGVPSSFPSNLVQTTSRSRVRERGNWRQEYG